MFGFVRKSLSLCIAVIMFFQLLPSYVRAAAENVNIFIDGAALLFENEPQIINGCFYVPLEETGKALGFDVNSENYSEGVYITQGKESLWLQSDNILAKYNGEAVKLEGSPRYVGEVFYIPIKALEVAFGYKVNINQKNASAELTKRFTLNICENGAAVTAKSSTGVFDGVNYSVEKNNISTDKSGFDYISSNENLASKLFYSFDASNLVGHKIKNLTLVFYAMRNWAGDPTFTVFSLPVKFNADEINDKNCPDYDKLPIGKKTYSTTGENIIQQKLLSKIEIDITPALKQITPENPYINIMLTSSASSGAYATAVAGINTQNTPSILAETKIDGSYEYKTLSTSGESRADMYLFNNIKLLFALGIFREKDEFPMDSDEAMTRAEFISYSLRMLNDNDSDMPNDNAFDDISKSDENYNSIIKAYGLGYISGGGSFRPNDAVTLSEACKILICILGNEPIAKKNGDWPYGYITAAKNCGVLKNINLNSAEDFVSYSNVYKLLYNTLIAERLVDKVYKAENTELEMTETENLLKIKFDAFFAWGIVNACEYTGTENASDCTENAVKIGDTTYNTDFKDLNNMPGLYVQACYIDNSKNDKKVIYAGADRNRNKTLRLDAGEILNAEKEGDSVKLRYRQSGRSAKSVIINKSMSIIFNGCAIDKQKKFNESLFMPAMGSIELVDNTNSGDYSVCYVTSYKDVVVASVDIENEVIYDKYRRLAKIELNSDEDDYHYTISDINGETYGVEQLKENNVLSSAISHNGKIIDLKLSVKTVSGTIESISDEVNRKFEVIISGYHCHGIADDDKLELDTGLAGDFYIDAFGNIAGANLGNEEIKIGYLIDAKLEDKISTVLTLQIFMKGTDEDNIPTYKCGEKIKVDGEKLDKAMAYNRLTENGALKRQLLCFSLNSKGQINYIDTVQPDVQKSDFELTERFTAQNGTLVYKPPYFGGKYIVDSDSFIISIPNDENDKASYSDITSLSVNTKLNADVYSLGANAIAADAIILKDYDTSANIGAGDYLAVVKKTSIMLEKDNELLQKLILNINGIDREVFVEENEATLVSDIHKGDVVRYTVNLKNRLKKIEKYYDSKLKTILNPVGAFNEEVEIYGGFAYYKENNYVRIVSDYHNILDTDDVHVLDCKSAEGIMYRFNPDEKVITVSKAVYGDISDFLSSKSDATGVICQLTYGNQYRTVILVDINKYTDSEEIENDDGDGLINLTLSDSVTEYVYKKLPGGNVTLPSTTFTKPFSILSGWSDGVRTYAVGSVYTIPDENITLTPIWSEGNEYTISIKEENAALTDASSPELNCINKSTTGNDEMNGKPSAMKNLWYRVNASELIGRDIGKVSLILNICRNWAGDPYISVHNVNDDWSFDSISFNNKPDVSTEKIADSGVLTGIDNSSFSEVEIDITKTVQNISSDNPYINIMLKVASITDRGLLVKGINSNVAPKIKVRLSHRSTVSFDGGENTVGDVAAISAEVGSKISLPECTFIKSAYSFEGWSDQTTLYQPGESYTIAENDTVLTAQWKFTGIYTLRIPIENAARISSDNPSVNTISIGNNSEDGITTSAKVPNDAEHSLYYKINAQQVAGKAIKSAKLKLNLSRNWNAYPTIKIFRVTEDWQSATVNYNAAPLYDTAPLVNKMYNTSAVAGTDSNPFIGGAGFATVEFDITKAFESVTSSDPYVRIRIDGVISSSSFTNPVFKVKGVNTPQAPVVLVELENEN